MNEKTMTLISKQGLVSWILEHLEENDVYDWDSEYQIDYAEGYHDAMLSILDYLGIEHDKEYYQ